MLNAWSLTDAILGGCGRWRGEALLEEGSHWWGVPWNVVSKLCLLSHSPPPHLERWRNVIHSHQHYILPPGMESHSHGKKLLGLFLSGLLVTVTEVTHSTTTTCSSSHLLRHSGLNHRFSELLPSCLQGTETGLDTAALWGGGYTKTPHCRARGTAAGVRQKLLPWSPHCMNGSGGNTPSICPSLRSGGSWEAFLVNWIAVWCASQPLPPAQDNVRVRWNTS